MPSDVAVGADQTVYVADGVNNRVLQFGPDGGLIRQVTQAGEFDLSRPLGVDFGVDGLLWIADTGNARIVALDATGTLKHEFRPAQNGRRPPDITDIAVDPAHGRVWFADNDADQIGCCELSSGAVTRFGASGMAMGQLQYPYSLAIGSGGDVLVSDVLNGRVQLLDRGGRAAAALGRYGVALGELYRPKGVAVAPDGDVWIGDSRIGVIQIFRATGECLGVLRDGRGQPLRFETPSGLAFDAGGDLYVAELGAERVVRVGIRRDGSISPPPPGPPHTTRQPRTCTSCHLEWMSPLVEGKSTELLSPPRNPANDPAVARSENCLSCHDGSIVDSRERVWIGHGHDLGMTPTPGMNVPKNFPLVDGGIACRTCHSAHTRGGAGETIARAVFLRVKEDPAELCIACHADHVGSAEHAGHRLAKLDAALPANLAAARAHVGKDGHLMTCLTCHNAHGGRERLLLDLSGSESQLCLSCHLEYSLADEPAGRERGLHPVDVALSTAQRASLQASHGTIGEGGKLVCSSCHSMHQPATDDYLLRRPLTGSEACRECHSPQTAVLATSHNIEVMQPDVANGAGFTAGEAGACSACHMVHQRARPALPILENDPNARCTTCHAEGELAASHALTSINHRGATCTECHNPHDDKHGSFLAQPANLLCRSCHIGYGDFLGGPHDITRSPANWPLASRESGGDCLACHRPHADDGGTLFRAGHAAGMIGNDAACVQCHPGAAWHGEGDIAALHPRKGNMQAVVRALPLGPGDELQCHTCHNAHAHADTKSLLRKGVPTATELGSLCITCHTDMAALHATAHGGDAMAKAGLDADACAPCHRQHGPRPAVPTKALLAAHGGSLMDRDPTSTMDPACSACHAAGGVAKTPMIATHPDVPMSSTRTGDGAMPLFDAAGQVSSNGRLLCRTCHLPHGRPELIGDANWAALSPEERRARGNLFREFRSPNLCVDCHGFEGYARFLYFHDPLRRKGEAAVDDTPALWRPR